VRMRFTGLSINVNFSFLKILFMILFPCAVNIFKVLNFTILPFLMEAPFFACIPLTLSTGWFMNFMDMLLNRIYPAKDKNIFNLRNDAI